MMNDWQSFEVANPVGASRIRKIVTEARTGTAPDPFRATARPHCPVPGGKDR